MTWTQTLRTRKFSSIRHSLMGAVTRGGGAPTIAAGIKPNIPSPMLGTPLLQAVGNDDEAVVQLLLGQKGGKPKPNGLLVPNSAFSGSEERDLQPDLQALPQYRGTIFIDPTLRTLLHIVTSTASPRLAVPPSLLGPSQTTTIHILIDTGLGGRPVYSSRVRDYATTAEHCRSQRAAGPGENQQLQEKGAQGEESKLRQFPPFPHEQLQRYMSTWG